MFTNVGDRKHAGHNGNLYGKQVEKLMSAR
jgi:hypothetical protein